MLLFASLPHFFASFSETTLGPRLLAALIDLPETHSSFLESKVFSSPATCIQSSQSVLFTAALENNMF